MTKSFWRASPEDLKIQRLPNLSWAGGWGRGGGRGGLVMKIQRNKLMGHWKWVLERIISLGREREKEHQETGYYSAAGLGFFKWLITEEEPGVRWREGKELTCAADQVSRSQLSASGMKSCVPLGRGDHQELNKETGKRALFWHCCPLARVFSELMFLGSLNYMTSLYLLSSSFRLLYVVYMYASTSLCSINWYI